MNLWYILKDYHALSNCSVWGKDAGMGLCQYMHHPYFAYFLACHIPASFLHFLYFFVIVHSNSPSEEPPTTAEKEEETVESDHEGEPFNIETE